MNSRNGMIILKLTNKLFIITYYKLTNFFPVPTRYTLVPCSVYGPGLQPKIRQTRDDSCSTFGITVAMTNITYNDSNSPKHEIIWWLDQNMHCCLLFDYQLIDHVTNYFRLRAVF